MKYKQNKSNKGQVGIKMKPELIKKIQSFALSHGTTLSALMRQATLEYIKSRINGSYTPGNKNMKGGV